MNIFLTVNEDWSINENQSFTNKLKGNEESFQQLTKNKVVVFSENFLLQNPNKKILKDKICVCFSKNSIANENNVFNNLKSLFEFLSFYNSENIFVIGDLELSLKLLPYCKKAYITKMQLNNADNNFENLDNNSQWELVNTSNPLFENNIVYYFCEYVNKNPIKYNYLDEDEITF